MTYWPDDQPEPAKAPSPFDEVFQDAEDSNLSWPVCDRYGLVRIVRKIIGASDVDSADETSWGELERKDPAEAKRVLALAKRLMQREGIWRDVGPWIIFTDEPRATYRPGG